ncbi:MAG: cell division protein ZapE [Alphaproteobacteria bacterium]
MGPRNGRLADGARGASYRPVAERYAALVARADIAGDPAQVAAADHLDRLGFALAAPTRPRPSLLWWRSRKQPAGTGLYLYGDVGRGKTMLMDMFYDAAPVSAKRRIHFNGFMADVHERVHAVREAERLGERAKGDPVMPVAAAIAGEIRLLCLDEFAVTDIADAMILARLFAALFEKGLVVVATSNTAPDALYRDGLNRALFLPFIELLKQLLTVVRFDAGTDYRLQMLSGQPIYLTPADATATGVLDGLWRDLTRGARGADMTLRFKGRDLIVPLAACDAARFDFADLCEKPLGPNDYLTIARTFHTVFVDRIPVIAAARRDVARRFVLLIDTLYDQHVKLIATADSGPRGLYEGAGEVGAAFARTVSRLVEMQSQAYLATSHGRRGAAQDGSVDGSLAPSAQSG